MLWSFHESWRPYEQTWLPCRHHGMVLTMFRHDHRTILARSWYGSNILPTWVHFEKFQSSCATCLVLPCLGKKERTPWRKPNWCLNGKKFRQKEDGCRYFSWHCNYFEAELQHSLPRFICQRLFKQFLTSVAAPTQSVAWLITWYRHKTSHDDNAFSSSLTPQLHLRRHVAGSGKDWDCLSWTCEITCNIKLPRLLPNAIYILLKTRAKSMGVLYAALGSSSEDITLPTSNSVPEQPGTTTVPSPGRTAGFTEESNTKT